MFCQLLVGVLLLTPPLSSADDKIDGKLLIGKWAPEKLPEGLDKMTVEFTKDKKVMLEVEVQGNKQKHEGTYELEGSTLSFKIEVGSNTQDQKRKIVKLTEGELVTQDEQAKEERKYKKVK